jgi:two-component system sensor histidine kinase KdpD
VRKEWHSLEEVIGASLTLLEPDLGSRLVHVSLPRDFPLIPMDAVLFEQVVRNLIENANKYSPSDCPIDIQASVEHGTLHMEVADRGPGFAMSEEKRVFEKFYRGAQGAARPGVGLGLAICQGIVEAHGGTILATNRPEGGALFTVRLPLEGMPPQVDLEEGSAAMDQA